MPRDAGLVFTAGEVGATPDGVMPATIEAQCAQTWSNIAAILAASGSSLTQVINVRGYIVDRAHLGAYSAAMEHALGTNEPSSTLVVVAGLAHPEFLVEIEVVSIGA